MLRYVRQVHEMDLIGERLSQSRNNSPLSCTTDDNSNNL